MTLIGFGKYTSIFVAMPSQHTVYIAEYVLFFPPLLNNIHCVLSQLPNAHFSSHSDYRLNFLYFNHFP